MNKDIHHKIKFEFECWQCGYKTEKDIASLQEPISAHICPICSDKENDYLIYLDPIKIKHEIELDYETFKENKFRQNNHLELFPIWCEQDETNLKHFNELRTKQMNNTETYSLYNNIAQFILPRLKMWLKRKPVGYPDNLTYEEWLNILNKIVRTMEIIAKDNCHKKDEELNKGLDLFRKYFFHLWD